MDSKLLVFVVLATLGQSAFARRSTPCCVLSEKERGVLSKLRADHEAAILAKDDVKRGIFGYLNKLVAGYLSNRESTTFDDDEAAAVFAEINRKDKTSVDYMLNATRTALGKRRCNDIEKTRAAMYDILDKTYVAVPQQMKLALSGRTSGNDESSFLAMIKGLVTYYYDLLRTCYNITDDDTLAVMKTAEHRSLTGLIHYATFPFLDSLKRVTNAVASGNKNRTLLHQDDTALLTSFAGVRIELIPESATLDALYFKSVLNHRGIMHGLYLIRYASIVASAKYKEVVKTFFRELSDQLYHSSSQLLKKREEVLSRIDLANAKTVALYEEGADALIEVCLFLRPRDSGEVKHVQKVLNALTYKITANIFKMIEVATDKDKCHSQIIAEMHTLENELVPLCCELTETFLGVISGGKDSSEGNHNESKNIENTFIAASTFVRIIRGGVMIVAKTVHKNGAASTDDISELQDFEEQGEVAAGNYIGALTNAFCL